MAALGRDVVSGIADKWRQLSGENNWDGLLDPLDFDLRCSIINYEDRANAIADAFNDKKVGDFHGFSRYPKENLFNKLGVTARNSIEYTVTDFIYSRVEKESTWCAYVAVATDDGKKLLGRRDIVVSWRGSVLPEEWGKDYNALVVPVWDIIGHFWHLPQVHAGFLSIYTTKSSESAYNKFSAREQVLAAIRKLVDQYKDEEVSITVTGHSMGAALATLNAMDIASNGYNKPTINPNNVTFPVTSIVFASPRVGNQGFKAVYEELMKENNLHVLRVTNAADPVPRLPVKLLPPLDYVHVGENLEIDSRLSPYLNEKDVNVHSSDVYEHVVAGTQGSKGGFNLEVKLDYSMVNKLSKDLKDEFNVPTEWWVEENKGMVLQKDGSYKLEFYVPDP